jgi:hypothetical protein
MKMTKQDWAITIAIIVIAGIAIFGVAGGNGIFSVVGSNTEKLDCTTEQQCLDQFTASGMPNGFLQANGITISCNGGVCYANK